MPQDKLLHPLPPEFGKHSANERESVHFILVPKVWKQKQSVKINLFFTKIGRHKIGSFIYVDWLYTEIMIIQDYWSNPFFGNWV